jgi:hypothetical protein
MKKKSTDKDSEAPDHHLVWADFDPQKYVLLRCLRSHRDFLAQD